MTIPLHGAMTPEHRESVVAGYTKALSATSAALEAEKGMSAGTALACAHVALAGSLNRLLDEAAGRVRADRGLPTSPEEEDEPAHGSHRERGAAEAERALRAHTEGGKISLEDVEYLLCDLMHYAGADFDDLLESAISQHQAECGEDADAAEEAIAGKAAGFAGQTPEERRLQEARSKMLVSHKQLGFDA